MSASFILLTSAPDLERTWLPTDFIQILPTSTRVARPAPDINGFFSLSPAEQKDRSGLDWFFIFYKKKLPVSSTIVLVSGELGLDFSNQLCLSLIRATSSENWRVRGEEECRTTLPNISTWEKTFCLLFKGGWGPGALRYSGRSWFGLFNLLFYVIVVWTCWH